MPFVIAAGAGGKAFVLGVGATAGFLQVGEDIEAGDVRAAQFDFVMTAGGVAVGMSGRTKAPIQISRDAHERAVASFIRAVQQNGYEVVGTEIEVKVPNYPRGRKYDVVLRHPVTKDLGGIEIKSSVREFNETIPKQSDADTFVNRIGGTLSVREPKGPVLTDNA